MLTRPSDPGIFRLLESVGLPVSDRVAQTSFVYDGHSIALRLTKSTWECPEQLLHEACHFIVATPEERLLPEYGLGVKLSARLESPYTLAYDKIDRMPRDDRLLRETCALYLHQLVGDQVNLGFKPEIPIRTFADHLDRESPGWRDRAEAWFSKVQLDVPATMDRMVCAYFGR